MGTVTEINDYLRLLWARVGKPICPNDGTEISSQSVEQMVDRVCSCQSVQKFNFSPIVRQRKVSTKVLERIKREGFVRVRIDGDVRDIDNDIDLEKQGTFNRRRCGPNCCQNERSLAAV